jgi:two-component system cell cycle response regulator DivK
MVSSTRAYVQSKIDMATILLIEDNRANKILVERILEGHGDELIYAVNGESGIQAALEREPDLILLDMGLPDIDGQTVVTLLKQIPATREIPIVAVTAWPKGAALEIAKRYELAGCILKPIDVGTFRQQIAEFLPD